MILAACFLLAGSRSPAAAGKAGGLDPLPQGWRITSSSAAPAEQLARISAKLGGRITHLTNAVLAVDQSTLQVNTMDCASEGDAEAVRKTILGLKANPAFCLRRNTRVVEFVCADVRLAVRAGYAMRLVPLEAAYRVSFTVAPVAQCDYMSANALFNLFLSRSDASRRKEVDAEIAGLRGRFVFGDALCLRSLPGKGKEGYSFSTPPDKTELAAQGDVQRLSFKTLPTEAGIPYVTVSGTIRVKAFSFRPSGRGLADHLRIATKYWPSDSGAIKQLAKDVAGGCTTDERKVQAVLDWLMPGRNLRFAGDVTGSRYGVEKVLKQGYGHCWDFADVFVTLCRASGVPCRQVGGWLYEQSGHIWAEVLIQGKGWQQVDPTGGMACGSRYIPFFTTEDGEMPIVYLAMPLIEPVADK